MLDDVPHRPALLGAAAALVLGLGFGAALKAEVSPESSYGQQLMLGERRARPPGAFEAWYPSEGPPPAPWMEVADLRTAERDGLDAAIDRLLAWRPDAAPPPPVSAPPPPPAEPLEVAVLPAGPQPYAPDPEPPESPPPTPEPASWGWALPGGGPAPLAPDAYAPPVYPGAAAG